LHSWCINQNILKYFAAYTLQQLLGLIVSECNKCQEIFSHSRKIQDIRRETGERKGDGMRVDRELGFVILVQLFFHSFRMRVARLLLCCVLLEDYSTNLGGTAITSDAMRQDGSSSATNPTLSGTYPCIYSSAYCRLIFPFLAPPRRAEEKSRRRKFSSALMARAEECEWTNIPYYRRKNKGHSFQVSFILGSFIPSNKHW